jgi:D-threo-aldose 1-dehydrogenase
MERGFPARLSQMGRLVPPGPLGCGGAPLGNLYRAIDDEAAQATLEAAWRCGVRHFDTAPFYGFGLSEQRMGAALRRHPRDAFTLSTKVGRLLSPGIGLPRERHGYVDALKFEVKFDYSADGALRSIEASLRRLALDRIDIAYIHDVGFDTHGADWLTAFDTAMTGAAVALTRLREEGVIKAWGLGVNLAAPCVLALQRADPDVFLLAGRYTLMDYAAGDILFADCLARGVSVVAGGPYNSGLLAGGSTYDYRPAGAGMIALRDRLSAVCARHGVDLRSAALQFCAAHPAVACVIPGARSAAEMLENARLMQAVIPGALWDELRALDLLPEHAPTP